MTNFLSKNEIIILTLIALAGTASYISGLDYWLADVLSHRTAHGISLFASTWYYFAYFAGGVAYIYRRNRRAALAIVVSAALLFLMQDAFTHFAPRARPPQAMPIGDGLLKMIKGFGGSSSFFSGHTATSMAVATAFILLGIHPEAALMLAVPVMVSRVTLVQHYLSDVMGGIIFGYVTTKVVCVAFGALKKPELLEKHDDHQQKE